MLVFKALSTVVWNGKMKIEKKEWIIIGKYDYDFFSLKISMFLVKK